jgi:hypothetical protein
MGFLLQNNQFSRRIKCLNKNSPYISVAKVGRSAAEENLNKLQTVHNFATRTVTVTRKPSQDKEKFRSTRKIPPNENRLKWQYPLNYRFIFGTRSWRTNICIGHVPSYLSCQFIKRCVSKRTTRSSASDLFITVYSQLMELIRNFFKTQWLIKPVYFILVEGYCRWKLSSGNLYLLDQTMRNRSEKCNFRSLAGIEPAALRFPSTILFN